MEQQGKSPESSDLPDTAEGLEPVGKGHAAPDTGPLRALELELRNATTLADMRAVFRANMKALWPADEFFFALIDRSCHRFMMLLEDGQLVPKPASNFALEHFLTSPGKEQAYAERLHTDPELLGDFRDQAGPEGLTIHSLAVPFARHGFLRGAVGILSVRVFEWDKETVARLKELGRLFLQAYDTVRRLGALAQSVDSELPDSKEEWRRLRELIQFRDIVQQILLAQLPPADVIAAACREFQPFFSRYRFTIAVHHPENHLFVVYSPNKEPVRVFWDETIEGYFLCRREEQILAVEDTRLWTPPSPLMLGQAPPDEFQSGLFAAGQVQDSLVAVVGLRSASSVAWEVRELELTHEAAEGVGLAFYQAMLRENLTSSFHEVRRQLDEAQNEALTWRQRADQLEAAAELARAIQPSENLADFLKKLVAYLEERWPASRVTIQQYLPDLEGFATFPRQGHETSEIRPARSCIQSLFRNNVPVSHILCGSPQEIAYYEDLDPRLVAECEELGYRSFCAAPIFAHERLWGAITIQRHDPFDASDAELLTCLASAVAPAVAATELIERVRTSPR